MKNLMVFVAPATAKGFTPECSVLVKIQIDNSLRLGWKPQDLLLVTNFAYAYNGVKAILVGDDHYCPARPRSIKTSIIGHLYDEGIMEPGQIYWNHDMDAFQANPMTEAELELDGFDAGLTDYGWKPRWCMGSFFVKHTSKDIFEAAKPVIFSNIEDEESLYHIADSHKVNERCKRLNITYNLGMRRVPENVERATKPVKVVHFHPRKPGLLDLFKPLMPDGLVEIMGQHGYK